MAVPAELPNPNDDEAPRIRWRVAFVAFTALGILRFCSFYLDDVTRALPGTFTERLLEECTGAYASLLLFPIIVTIERRFPLTLGRWRRNWPPHVGAFFIYTIAHTSVLAGSRAVLSPLVGLGVYDYGRMPARYFMEGSIDVLVYIILAGMLTALRTHRRMRNREVRAAALERDAVTARLQALSLQLQPHFLFNALNTISSTVYDDPVAADEMIGRLGELLRHSLRTTERQEITVDEELATLRAYLTFVEARFGDRLHVVLSVEPSTSSLAIPAFMLQPLVENAVRHGATTEFQQTDIRIELARRGADFQIVIENDMHVAPDEPLQLGTGLGTTRDRLRLLYGDTAELVTTADHGRFRVTVRIPARTLATAPAPSPLGEHAGAHR